MYSCCSRLRNNLTKQILLSFIVELDALDHNLKFKEMINLSLIPIRGYLKTIIIILLSMQGIDIRRVNIILT